MSLPGHKPAGPGFTAAEVLQLRPTPCPPDDAGTSAANAARFGGLACSLCETPILADDVALTVWNSDGWRLDVCEVCQVQWRRAAG